MAIDEYELPNNLQLTDEGSRYEHYQELLELWKSGYEVLKNVTSRFNSSEMDEKRLSQLTAGIDLMSRQMEIMANYDKKSCSLRAEVNSIEGQDGK